MSAKQSIDLAELRRKLSYDPETGAFRWIASQSNRASNGSAAGCITPDGYLQIKVLGYFHLAHRLAWFYVHGTWPVGQIDHRNGVRADNKLSNLRDIPAGWNQQNMRSATKSNKSGLLGVSRYRNGYRATIKVSGKQKQVGVFATPAEAYAAYVVAKRLYHPAGTL